jgi:hypothetical protein
MHYKHTKGPWKLVKKVTQGQFGTDYQIRNDDNWMIAEIGPNSQDANAALIAAAPEMLEALERIEKRLQIACQETPAGEHYMLEAFHAELAHLIKKARGE